MNLQWEYPFSWAKNFSLVKSTWHFSEDQTSARLVYCYLVGLSFSTHTRKCVFVMSGCECECVPRVRQKNELGIFPGWTVRVVSDLTKKRLACFYFSCTKYDPMDHFLGAIIQLSGYLSSCIIACRKVQTFGTSDLRKAHGVECGACIFPANNTGLHGVLPIPMCHGAQTVIYDEHSQPETLGNTVIVRIRK